MVRQVACRALLVSLAVALGAEGFQCYSPGVGVGRSQDHATKTSTTLSKSLLLLPLASSTSSTSSDDIVMDGTNTELSTSELQTLFKLLSDTTILYDPSRGTCCRNKCSGCTFLDPANGNFIYDEHTADDDSTELGGWLAPYVKVDFGERVHISRWSQLLFSNTQPAKEIERDELATLLLLGDSTLSPLALQSLWNVISPSAGYPKLSLTEITRAIKGMEGSAYEMGGAVNYNVFETNMRSAAQTIVQLGGVDKLKESDATTINYDSMSKEELLEECISRGMSTSFPKMKRIIIEELRFFDANGRQGKRHPVKNTLS
jgi:hypothetical protein